MSQVVPNNKLVFFKTRWMLIMSIHSTLSRTKKRWNTYNIA